MISVIRSWFLTRRFFVALAVCVAGLVLSYWLPVLLLPMKLATVVLGAVVLGETILLYGTRRAIDAERVSAARLSNGDDNLIRIVVTSRYAFRARLEIIDELPHQFQIRTWSHHARIGARGTYDMAYTLRPLHRGEYRFGAINVFAGSPIGFVQRRFSCDAERMLPVYPSYIQMKKFELLAFSNRLSRHGMKRIRRIGHTMEFEKIKQYVAGDDVRTMNWKATARSGEMMVNQYQDERSQDVYSVIDMGRAMKMPFDGMTLLDYAVNASLVISNIAIKKHDRVGLITYGHQPGNLLASDGTPSQMGRILESLYHVDTDFRESSDELLYSLVKNMVRQRSLLLYYTNVESITTLRRRIPYLRAIARRHLLVVLLFENTELKELTKEAPETVEGIYVRTVAEITALQKREIVRELQRHGIVAVLTPPSGLTTATINTYLELKARGVI